MIPRSRFRIRIPLTGIEFEWDVNVRALLPRPAVVAFIGRHTGLTVDTAGRTADGSLPILPPVHAGPRQLWRLERTRYRGQCVITSVENGLALDAGLDDKPGRHPVMWSRHGEQQQRWRLHPTDDGAAFIIESVRTGHVLDVHGDPAQRESPILWERHGGFNQQFLLFQPARKPRAR